MLACVLLELIFVQFIGCGIYCCESLWLLQGLEPSLAQLLDSDTNPQKILDLDISQIFDENILL